MGIITDSQDLLCYVGAANDRDGACIALNNMKNAIAQLRRCALI